MKARGWKFESDQLVDPSTNRGPPGSSSSAGEFKTRRRGSWNCKLILVALLCIASLVLTHRFWKESNVHADESNHLVSIPFIDYGRPERNATTDIKEDFRRRSQL